MLAPKEILMKTMIKQAGMLAAAGVLAVSIATPSFARDGGRVAAAAGVGFVAGALIGTAAANNGYYGPDYAYYGPDYAYGPDYYAPAPRYVYRTAPAYASYPDESYAYVPAPSPRSSIHVYDDKGQYVGSDPDPRVRQHIFEDSRDR
jgi:hypothetical protein